MNGITGIGSNVAIQTPQTSQVNTVPSVGHVEGRELTQVKPDKGLLERLGNAISRRLPDHSMLDHHLTSDGKVNQESRRTFSMLKDKVVHFVTSLMIKGVRSSVEKHGGEIGFKFAQTKGTFLDQIMKHKDSSAGVCESISAHWMASHAKNESIFDKLYVAGEKGQFQIDTLVSIKQLQIDGIQEHADQNQTTQSWLGNNGLVPQMRTETRGSLSLDHPVRLEGTTGSSGATKLVAAILDTAGETSIYKKIGISGAMAGHAVAAFVDNDEGVTFFDPNFGEFSFPDKASFSNWFTQDFWTGSLYSIEKGLGQEFEISNYKAKKA